MKLRRTHGALLLAALVAGCGPEPDFAVVIRGGTVYDGSGRPGFVADVGVRGERIVAVGDLSGQSGADEVDASGLFVAPGFINLHSHDRLGAASTALNMLQQGVTTIVLNADGGGPLDLDAQLADAEAGGLALNVAPNIGFNSVWAGVNGPENRRPTEEQVAEMRGMIERGLAAGAWGVSAGLDYKPAYYATTGEVEAVLSRTGRWRTVFTNHDRLTPESNFSSYAGMRETMDIGLATGLGPVITHMKVQGREQGMAGAVLDMMDHYTDQGARTVADAYPYLAGQTSLSALIIPGWAQEGGWEAMLKRFADPGMRARIVDEANEALDARFGGAAGVFLPQSRRELTDLMTEIGATTGGDAVIRILQREEDNPAVILRFGSEDDLREILAYPETSIACDCDPADGRVGHPRYYGTFPRVLGHYTRELGVLSWENAIRKMTGLPAATIGMIDRGGIAPGMAADITVFDPETVIDHATFDEPDLPSDGIVRVMVNGQWAWRNRRGGKRAGQALRRGSNLPARAMSTGEDRSVSLSAPLEVVGGGSWSAVIDVRQGAGERTATGTFALEGSDPDRTVASVVLGELQTGPGWAGFTGWATLGDGEERAVTVTVDQRDPTERRTGTTVVVTIDGGAVVRGWTPEAG